MDLVGAVVKAIIVCMSQWCVKKFCKIAEGIYDYYPRFGPCCEWDTAAGACILQNAGGSVLDENGVCDNFSIADLAQAVRLSNGKLPLEASGNIDENTILAVAKTGVPKMIYSRLFSLPQALIEKPSASQLNRKDRSIA
jgi:hypothetical protein